MSSQRCTDIEENPDTTLPDPSPSLTDVELSRRSFVKAAGILTADLSYRFLDPRIRVEQGG